MFWADWLTLRSYKDGRGPRPGLGTGGRRPVAVCVFHVSKIHPEVSNANAVSQKVLTAKVNYDCLSVCMSIYLSVCPSVCLPVCLSLSLSLFLSTCPLSPFLIQLCSFLKHSLKAFPQTDTKAQWIGLDKGLYDLKTHLLYFALSLSPSCYLPRSVFS